MSNPFKLESYKCMCCGAWLWWNDINNYHCSNPNCRYVPPPRPDFWEVKNA